MTDDYSCFITSEVPLTYLALGDSYTAGTGVADSERWPVQLSRRLLEEGASIDSPQIVAMAGWTTRDLRSAIPLQAAQGPYDLVSLLIGVNNQAAGWDTESYQAEFTDLLDQAITLAGGDAGAVLVLSIPDWGVTPYAQSQRRDDISPEIDAFNAINREVSIERGVRYIDITPISRMAADDPTLLAEDELHPSAAMYAQWVELALPAACAALMPH
jgi:lysophospholipase L1-like esterase